MSLQAHNGTGDRPDAALILAGSPDVASEADRRLAVCAHELRTPIGGMLALTDLLLASDLDEAQRRHAGALRQAAGHLLAVADTILDTARPDDAVSPPSRFDLRELLRAALIPLVARGRAKGVAVRVEVADLPAAVVGDPVILRRIIDNLADNALKVTAEGEIVIRASWQPRPGIGTLRLLVEDTGPGFGSPPLSLARGASAGQGLGLALVSSMAERLGGRVAAADRSGGGASVIVELPLERVAEPLPAPRPEPRAAAGGRTGLRILVVENNAAMRIAIGSMLDKLGHGYRMVGRGPAAVEHVTRGEADLVLVAAPSLPIGTDAIRAIRGMQGQGASLPIFAVVAPGDEGLRAALQAAGADAVLAKPISLRDLGDAIVAAAQRIGDGAEPAVA